TVGGAHRDVSGTLAGGPAAVVATRAIGCDGKAAVIDFGAQPTGGGLVAVLANGLTGVHRRCGLDTGMASGALGCDRYAGVQLGWRPRGVACLVAAVAVTRSQARHELVGNMDR